MDEDVSKGCQAKCPVPDTYGLLKGGIDNVYRHISGCGLSFDRSTVQFSVSVISEHVWLLNTNTIFYI